MDISLIRFPVKCPCCGEESLVASRLDAIENIVTTERPLTLSANCAHHRVVWLANAIERDQIREYAAAVQY